MLRQMSMKSLVVCFGLLVLMGWTDSNGVRADWKEEWDKTVKAANKEGQVVLYGGYNPRYRKLNSTFEKRYPGIKLNFTPGGGVQHAIRILSERRVKKYLADVVMGGKTAFVKHFKNEFEPIQSILILPEVTDASKWWGGKHHFIDREEKYVISSTAYVSPAIAINTKLVDPKEIQSVKDLLNPKWKGKILQYYSSDPALTTVILFIYNTPGLGPKFLSRLYSEMDFTFTRNLRQGVNWLGQGKYSLYIGGTNASIYQANKKGLPVSILPHALKEGEIMEGGYCCLGVLDRAPHPNASKVFVNWLLSKEGQTTWQKLKGYPISSLRRDIPKDYIDQKVVPKEGKKYFYVNQASNYDPKDLDAIRKIVTPAIKKRKR